MPIKTLRCVVAAVTVAAAATSVNADQPVARQWNDLLLDAIRKDFARPTVHARNLFHTSIVMWDSWAAYDCYASPYLITEGGASASNRAEARDETLSYAVYRVLSARFAKSPGADEMLPRFDEKMAELGYDISYTATVGDTPAALGNRIAVTMLFFGLNDGANEAGGYANLVYEPVNPPLLPALPGNPEILDTNRWQPLALDFFIDQSGNIILGGYPEALSPEWGIVTSFALSQDDLTIYERDGFDYWVFHDPGPPPMIGTGTEDEYKAGFEQVVLWSALLDPTDGEMIDISPASRGDNDLGTNNGNGYKVNPVTGEPYEPQFVPAGDYYRVLAEFWADGPDSETPPGHWFTLLNYVADHPASDTTFGGSAPLDELEWYVRSYLALSGGVHDSAVAAWGMKGWYDYIRPISALRYMADHGQCSDPDQDSYNEAEGIHLYPGIIEVVTAETTQPGERHEHLVGEEGKIAFYAWRGPDYIQEPETDVAGVGWILAENWWPYQRPSFVTPPFPGYVSGHSTFSRAAAEILTQITGSQYFPAGLGEFFAGQNEFLVFEDGPSQDLTLQWASYYDAADECSLSRIYGGIHPRADDIPGRLAGSQIGMDAFTHATTFMEGEYRCDCPMDLSMNGTIDFGDIIELLGAWGPCGECPEDLTGDGNVDFADVLVILSNWGTC